jgi:hypothetical protein
VFNAATAEKDAFDVDIKTMAMAAFRRNKSKDDFIKLMQE